MARARRNDAIPDEVEVKLEAPTEAIEAIGRLRSVGTYRLRPRRVQELHTVYLDTATHALARAGVALRLRRDGRHWEATAKWPGRVSGALHARPELTVPLPGEPALPFALPEGPLREHLRDVVLDRPLQPVLITNVRRRPLELLPARGTRALAEVALDLVQLCDAAGVPAAPPYGEVEIERRSGSADDCLDAGRLLRRQFDLIPSSSTKYLRGLIAVYGDTAPRRAGGRAPEAATPLAAALRIAIATQLERWRAAAPATRADQQAEPLHEMRVAMRRMRTVLRAFPDALPTRQRDALLRELAWLGQEPGRVRDYDVLLARADHLAAHTSEAARRALAGYRRHLQRARRAARGRLVAALEARRTRALLLALERLAATVPARGLPARAAQPFAAAARRAVRKALRRLRRRGRGIGGLADAAELHALRIRAKRARYVLELVAPLGGSPCRDLVKQVVGLQDALGAFNDASVAAAELRRYRDGLDRGSADAAAIAHLADLEIRHAGAAEADFRRAWKRFTAKRTKRAAKKLQARLE